MLSVNIIHIVGSVVLVVTLLLNQILHCFLIRYCIASESVVVCIIMTGPLVSTMNVHQLRHLKVHVQNWGPLWCFSCFGFESVNGDIKKLFHGTREMSEQVMQLIILLNIEQYHTSVV